MFIIISNPKLKYNTTNLFYVDSQYLYVTYNNNPNNYTFNGTTVGNTYSSSANIYTPVYNNQLSYFEQSNL